MSQTTALLVVGIWLIGALGSLMISRDEHRAEMINARNGRRNQPPLWPYLVLPALWPIMWALVPLILFVMGAVALTEDV